MSVSVRVWVDSPYDMERAHETDSGFDVRAIDNYIIEPGSVALIHTGIYMELPPGYECQVRSRSGLALQHQVFVLNSPGTIDAGYRGECNVILANFSKVPYTVKRGDRIAQFVFSKLPEVKIERVDSSGELLASSRSVGGFGSTGLQ